uniref:Protein FAM76B n=1 Tax=Lygus hesperus TaxID=30085 RepID=A0A0A9WQ27_LYGHE
MSDEYSNRRFSSQHNRRLCQTRKRRTTSEESRFLHSGERDCDFQRGQECSDVERKKRQRNNDGTLSFNPNKLTYDGNEDLNASCIDGSCTAGFVGSSWNHTGGERLTVSYSSSNAAVPAPQGLRAASSQAFRSPDVLNSALSSVNVDPRITRTRPEGSLDTYPSITPGVCSTEAGMTDVLITKRNVKQTSRVWESTARTPDSGIGFSSSRSSEGYNSPFSWLNMTPTSPDKGDDYESFDNPALFLSVSSTSSPGFSMCHAQRSNCIPNGIKLSSKYPTSFAPSVNGHCSFQSPSSINSADDSGVEASFTRILHSSKQTIKANLTQSQIPASSASIHLKKDNFRQPSSHQSTTAESPTIRSSGACGTYESEHRNGYAEKPETQICKLIIDNLQRQLVLRDLEIKRKDIFMTKIKAEHFNVMNELRTAQRSQQRSAEIFIESLKLRIRNLMKELAAKKKLLRKGKAINRKKDRKYGNKLGNISK